MKLSRKLFRLRTPQNWSVKSTKDESTAMKINRFRTFLGSACISSTWGIAYYRAQFFSALNTAICNLTHRLNKKALQASIPTYRWNRCYLAEKLMMSTLTLQAYHELNQHSLSVELQMFKSKFHNQSLVEAQMAFQKMGPKVWELFTAVEELELLMLTSPVTSCLQKDPSASYGGSKTGSEVLRVKNVLNAVASSLSHQPNYSEQSEVATTSSLICSTVCYKKKNWNGTVLNI